MSVRRVASCALMLCSALTIRAAAQDAFPDSVIRRIDAVFAPDRPALRKLVLLSFIGVVAMQSANCQSGHGT